jgi:hypothetical protein
MAEPGEPVTPGSLGFISGRGTLALMLVLIFFVTILGSFIAAIMLPNPESWNNTKELLDVIIPIETGLLGTVFGYFFGRGMQAG